MVNREGCHGGLPDSRVARYQVASKEGEMSDQRQKSSIWAWLVVLGCIGFYSIPTGVIGNTSGIFVAPVMDDFGWSQTDATMYRTIQPIVSAMLAPFAGKILQKGNPRWILAVVSFVFGLSSFLSAFATEVWMWNAYGVAFGVTAAFFMYLAAPVLVNAWFRKGNGTAIAITAAALSLLAAVASPIGQSLVNAYGWQVARAVLSLAVTISSVLLTIAFVRKSPEEMGLLPWGADESSDASITAENETSGAEVRDALRSPALYTLLVCCGVFVVCAAFFQQIPAFCARGALGADAGAAAISIIMIGGIIGKLVLGSLNDVIGVQYTGIIAALGGALGITLAWLSGSNAIQFYIGMAVFGLGYAGLTVVAPMLARAAFGQKSYSQIYSYCSTVIFLASAFAFLIFATIYDRTGSFDLCFALVIALYCMVAVLVPFTVRRGRRIWNTERK